MNLIWQNLPAVLSGVWLTFQLVILALVVGFILASLFAALSFSQFKIVTMPIRVFSFAIRGTPLLVQIYLIYYGASQFGLIRDTVLWEFFQHPFACAVLALSLNTAAYTMELLIGAIKKVPQGEIDAARAFAMRKWTLWQRILAPNAIRIVLPAYSNEVILLLKASSLASTITLLDLMGVTNRIIGETYEAIPFLMLAGVFYLALNSISMTIFKMVEKRLRRSHVRRLA